MGSERAPPGPAAHGGPGRRALGALAGAWPARAGAAGATASGPITLLVGAAPGTAADPAGSRGFAPFLERHLPRAAVAVVNRPGEGGLAAARASPAPRRMAG